MDFLKLISSKIINDEANIIEPSELRITIFNGAFLQFLIHSNCLLDETSLRKALLQADKRLQ